MRRLIASMLLVAATAAGAGTSRDFAQLVDWMTGSFSSQAQSERDEAYYDIRLEMWPIWAEHGSGDEAWLYVEQAVAGREDAPYRQRVYRVRALDDGRVESAVYTLPGPERFVGAWKTEAPLATLHPDSLIEREGCAIVLERTDDDSFVGATGERSCPSDLRGASYATSEVRVFAAGLDSWDRGFDPDDAQVWGAEKGAYEFRRRTDED